MVILNKSDLNKAFHHIPLEELKIYMFKTDSIPPKNASIIVYNDGKKAISIKR